MFYVFAMYGFLQKFDYRCSLGLERFPLPRCLYALVYLGMVANFPECVGLVAYSPMDTITMNRVGLGQENYGLSTLDNLRT
jgi:hypothetical protein